jgi:hypothetical protein
MVYAAKSFNQEQRMLLFMNVLFTSSKERLQSMEGSNRGVIYYPTLLFFCQLHKREKDIFEIKLCTYFNRACKVHRSTASYTDITGFMFPPLYISNLGSC